MNLYAWIVLVALLGEFVLSVVTSLLNIRAMSPTVPDEFRPAYDDETYARAQAYTRTRTRFVLVHDAVSLAALLLFWQLSGFGWLDRLCRGAELGPVPTGLLFIGALVVGSTALGLPFRIYSTFVIEEGFGFNRTAGRTFVLDRLKGLALGAVLGGALLDYARSTQFPLDGITVIDGSRRSAKANAFFTGFGRHKRIALFDTLIEKQTTTELVAIVAHEVGHYQRRHILKGLTLSLAHTGVLFWLLSLFLDRQGLFDAFDVGEPSVHAGLVFFGLLFTPIELALSVLVNLFSRRDEFEVDAFAADTTGSAEPLITALKKLATDSLSNLTPHPLQVFLHHSHPPVLHRITALRALKAGEERA